MSNTEGARESADNRGMEGRRAELRALLIAAATAARQSRRVRAVGDRLGQSLARPVRERVFWWLRAGGCPRRFSHPRRRLCRTGALSACDLSSPHVRRAPRDNTVRSATRCTASNRPVSGSDGDARLHTRSKASRRRRPFETRSTRRLKCADRHRDGRRTWCSRRPHRDDRSGDVPRSEARHRMPAIRLRTNPRSCETT